MTRPTMLIPPDAIAAISGTTSGRCQLYFDVVSADSIKFLSLFVECYQAERAMAEQIAADEDNGWEWG